jgi:hypothetical protein
LIDQERMRTPFGLLEEERGATCPNRAIDDLGDLEVRIDLGRDANQLSFTLQESDPRPQIGGWKRHEES